MITSINAFATNLNDLSCATKLIPQTPLLPGGVLFLPLFLPRPSLPVLPLPSTVPRLPVRQQFLSHVRLREGCDFLDPFVLCKDIVCGLARTNLNLEEQKGLSGFPMEDPADKTL